MSDTATKSPAHLAGDRYTAVRRVLAANAPLNTTEYLLGQLLLVTMDLLSEVGGLRDELNALNATLYEHVVHGGKE